MDKDKQPTLPAKGPGQFQAPDPVAQVLLAKARQTLAEIGNMGGFSGLPKRIKPPALDQSENFD
ncbi:MAG: hypothetical protein RB292_04720 [Patescibacteria group bacterium]|jgi:hypothetical protein|nr:hypothetical protein [Patescibacteria group bacterium]